MMITKYHIMAERQESGIGRNGFKLALTTLLATVGVSVWRVAIRALPQNNKPRTHQ